jgi:hypothetical protein
VCVCVANRKTIYHVLIPFLEIGLHFFLYLHYTMSVFLFCLWINKFVFNKNKYEEKKKWWKIVSMHLPIITTDCPHETNREKKGNVRCLYWEWIKQQLAQQESPKYFFFPLFSLSWCPSTSKTCLLAAAVVVVALRSHIQSG